MKKSAPLVLIAALDRNFAIGRGNTIPWHLPDDFKQFKAATLGKPVLMGTLTALSLGRALPGRLNLVLTRQNQVPFEHMRAVSSIDEARVLAGDAEEICVIGGGQIYQLCLPEATRMRLTHVDAAIDHADAFFPGFNTREWVEDRRVHHAQDDRHAYAFDVVDYSRSGRQTAPATTGAVEFSKQSFMRSAWA